MTEPDDVLAPDGWPEGMRLARLYAECYGIPLPVAVELVYGQPPGGGWVSGGCAS